MSKKVLYIDDNQDLLDAARTVLEASGHAMTEAHTAAEGIDAYKAGEFDLILVDLMMETMDAGVTFAKGIQEQGNTTPAYILSSVGDEISETFDPRSYGLLGAYQKPLSPGKLLELLK